MIVNKRTRAEDFLDRHEYLGASEVGQACGLSDYGTDRELWEQKTLRAARTAHKNIFDRGHDMEPIMIGLLNGENVDVSLTQAEAFRDDRPWLVSHLDGIVDVSACVGGEIFGVKIPDWAVGDGVLEMKAPGSHAASKFKNGDIPLICGTDPYQYL